MNHSRHHPGLAVALVWPLLVLGATVGIAAPEIDFARDIRPILSDKCFQCHGPDDQARQAGLRLDMREGLFGDLGGYAAVAPGTPDESELIARVFADDEALRMPPPDSNKTLTAADKQLLRTWVEQGAKWSEHWAFQPPAMPELPNPEAGDWCRNPIDRFILRKLERSQVSPSSDAEPYKLVRRLYLDLIGLPPTPQEADEWVARIWPSSSAGNLLNEDAYQELVSYLLASPHYGERWARRWLDLARYADTNGYEKDRERSIWPYRDWVLNALNADMPFDQFTIEQLAGDMLPGATRDQRIATGFHRNTMLNEEGGIDPLEFRFRALTDRVATTGTTWLGLTLGCCQCHAHKYDPISHTEYYQVMAFLNNADEPQLALPDSDFEFRWEENRAEAQRLLASLAEKWRPPESNSSRNQVTKEDQTETNGDVAASEEDNSVQLQQAFAEWLQAERKNAVAWRDLQPVEATSTLPILTVQEDNSIFASGDTAKRDDYFLKFAPCEQPLTAIQLEALPDPRLPANGPGSTYYEGTLGDFFLTEIEAQVGDDSVAFESATESYAKNRYGKNPVSATLAIDGDVQTGWSVHDRQGERHVAVFVFEQAVPAGKALQLRLTFGRHFASSLGRFRVRATSSPEAPEAARDYPDEISNLLLRPQDELTASAKAALMEQFLLSRPQFSGLAERIRRLQLPPDVPHTLVMSEWPEGHRRSTHRHHRGEFLQVREEVQPATLAVLPTMPEDYADNRLGFAKWLVSPANPLTARVVVNRAWAAFFGTGLVRTLDDFGLQGEAPSHPELLDWLALQFVHEFQWSLKRLHRTIVSSSTYRQSSKVNARAQRVDPENRLLSYLPRVRLEAEIIRDSFLAASGILSEKMGGPPVRPPQPSGVTEVAYGNPKWKASDGEDRYRRSIYTFVKRTAPFAMLATFDAPSGEACVAQESRSNSPLQALTLLNDVMVMELASQAAEQVLSAGPKRSVRGTAERLFRRVLTRPPTVSELDTLSDFYESQRGEFQANRVLIGELMGSGEERSTSADDLQRSDTEKAAWTVTARAIFGLDEAQVRE